MCGGNAIGRYASLLGLCLCAQLAACAESPGRVSLEVTWSEEPVRPLWLWAHVRGAADGPDGIRYATAGPVEFRPGEPWSLALSDVPNGPDRVVVIEARARRQPDDRILYVGASEPFALTPGADVLARVDLVLDVPRVAANLDPIALRFDGEPRAVVGADHIDRAAVVFAADGAEVALIANDPTLTIGAARIELAADGRARCTGQAPRICTVEPWALTDGVPARGDGLYSVFVQLVDAAGYSSAIRSASVHLDTLPPELTLPRPVLQTEDGRLAVDGVLAARTGAAVELAFTVTEALGERPRITVGHTESAAEPLSPDGRTVRAVLTDVEEGRFAVEAAVVDLAGNAARLSLGTLERDDTPPPDLDALQPGLRLEVAPAGGAGLEPGAALRICPIEGADDCPVEAQFADDVQLEVHIAHVGADGVPRCAAEPLGVIPATPGVHPLPCDCPLICVAAIDPAGNRAAPVPILQARWHLRPGEGLPLGDRVEPMTHTLHRVFDGRMSQGEVQDPRDGVLAQRRGGRITVEGAARWRRAHPPPAAPPVEQAATAFHATRGEALWFGGQRVEAPMEAVDITGRIAGWHAVADVGDSPQARWGSAMVFDPQRDEIVLFGGFDGTRPRGDRWRWDGAWHFAEEVGADTPMSRYGHAMAWHPASRRALLFGGRRGDGDAPALGDLWAWDGTQWLRLRDGPDGAPPGRHSTALVADPTSDAIVLFGGADAGRALLGDTWLYADEGWRRVEAPGPPPRAGHALLAIDDGVVLVGGYDAGGPADSIWRFDGARWSLLGAPADAPARLERPVYDPVARQIISPAPPGATLPWLDGGPAQRWRARPPAPLDQPSMRAEAAVGATSDGAILVGGLDLEQGLRADTWRWDGWQWRRVAPGCVEAPCAGLTPRAGAAVLATDDGVMLFGGRDGRRLLDETWWLTAEGWRPAPVEGPERPRGRAGHGMAAIDGGALLFGGFSPADGSRWSGGDWSATTWLWDGLRWQAADVVDPPPARLAPGLVGTADGVLLWGGVDAEANPLNDQWRFDGRRWQRIAADAGAVNPPVRSDCALVVDRRGGGATLFQGQGLIDASAWRWDGLRWWRQDAIGRAPRLANRDRAALEARYLDPLRVMWAVEDPPSGEILVVAGAPGDGQVATWRWDGGGHTRPAQTVRIPLDHRAFEGAALAGLTVEVKAGGDSAGGSGVQLRAWDGATWVLLADGDAAARRPSTVRIELDGPAAERLRFGPDDGITLAVMPTTGNGSGIARVALEGLSVDAVWRRVEP